MTGVTPSDTAARGNRRGPYLEEGDSALSGVGTIARTGSNCPESGVWQVVGTPSTTAPIAKGNVMPPYNGQAVDWKLIQLA